MRKLLPEEHNRHFTRLYQRLSVQLWIRAELPAAPRSPLSWRSLWSKLFRAPNRTLQFILRLQSWHKLQNCSACDCKQSYYWEIRTEGGWRGGGSPLSPAEKFWANISESCKLETTPQESVCRAQWEVMFLTQWVWYVTGLSRAKTNKEQLHACHEYVS